jgi:hypothetical protein
VRRAVEGVSQHLCMMMMLLQGVMHRRMGAVHALSCLYGPADSCFLRCSPAVFLRTPLSPPFPPLPWPARALSHLSVSWRAAPVAWQGRSLAHSDDGARSSAHRGCGSVMPRRAWARMGAHGHVCRQCAGVANHQSRWCRAEPVQVRGLRRCSAAHSSCARAAHGGRL